MHCLNYRIGFLFRENIQKKSYEMRYFFIDDQANLFYLTSLARLQKIIRLSSDFKQIRTKLIKMGEKSFSLSKYNVGLPKNYQSQAILPFSNRTCIQIRGDKQAKDERSYVLFGLIDQDTPLLQEEILRLTGKKKIQNIKRKSVIEDQKNKQDERTLQFFNKYLANEEKFKMQNIEKGGEIEFQGDMESHQANGKCVQTLIKEGITYTGFFKNGKKHGTGLLVSESLDSFECQFINDELVGF